MSVKRIYVEKKEPYAVEAKQLLWEIRHILQIKTVTGLRLMNRYDVEGVSQELYEKCLPIVFSEPQVDVPTPSCPRMPRPFSPWNISPDSTISAPPPARSAFSWWVSAPAPRCAVHGYISWTAPSRKKS